MELLECEGALLPAVAVFVDIECVLFALTLVALLLLLVLFAVVGAYLL